MFAQIKDKSRPAYVKSWQEFKSFMTGHETWDNIDNVIAEMEEDEMLETAGIFKYKATEQQGMVKASIKQTLSSLSVAKTSKSLLSMTCQETLICRYFVSLFLDFY